MKLWIDDIRDPKAYGWENSFWAKDARTAMRVIKTGIVSDVSFDHDLGEKGGSGYDCAALFEELCVAGKIQCPTCRIHSSNPVGRHRIEQAMYSATRRATEPNPSYEERLEHLSKLTREDYREIARAFGIPRGQNTEDTLQNLRSSLPEAEKSALFPLKAAVSMTREQLRELARKLDIPRGQNKEDTIRNIEKTAPTDVLAKHGLVRRLTPIVPSIHPDFRVR